MCALFDWSRKVNDIDVLTHADALELVAAQLHTATTTDAYNQTVIRVHNYEIYGPIHIVRGVGTCVFALDAAMIAHTAYVPVDDVVVPVISAEDNVVFKAMLGRTGEKGQQDVRDMLFLSGMKALDFNYMQWRLGTCPQSAPATDWLVRLGIMTP